MTASSAGRVESRLCECVQYLRVRTFINWPFRHYLSSEFLRKCLGRLECVHVGLLVLRTSEGSTVEYWEPYSGQWRLEGSGLLICGLSFLSFPSS